MHMIRKTFSELVTDLSSFFGQGPRTTDSSVGATIIEGSSTREGGVTEKPPELQQQLQEKQRISKSGKLFEFNVSQTNRGKNIPVGWRMKHFLHNWEKFSGY